VDDARLRRLLRCLSEDGVDDLLLKAGSPPKVRLNGVLEPVGREADLTRADVDDAAVEMLGDAPRTSLDGPVVVTYTVDGVGRFRVAAYSQRGSTAVLVRRTPDRAPTIAVLGLPAQAREFAETRHGLVLVAGQRNSGRRRTLASLLDHINHLWPAHIVSVERTVELLHPDAKGSVSQLEVGVDVPSFGDGIRAARRADADVVVVTDIDDHDTACEVVGAAEDGLLVLAGIEAGSGVEAVERLVGLSPQADRDAVRLSLAGTLVGTLAQRLAPCAIGYAHVPVVEVICNSPEVTSCLYDESTMAAIDAIVERSTQHGMQTFAEAATDLMLAGAIDLRGLLSVIDDWQRVHRTLVDRGVL
jgi:twitching motility protein PilT